MLKRQGHIHGLTCSPVESSPLNIILEEDESRSSSPSSCYSLSSADGSSNLSAKARRRHATVSVSSLRLSRVFPTDDSLLNYPPRPAPQPPSRSASPDSFKLTYTDVSFKFPHPPIPTPTSLRKYDSDQHTQCDSPTSSVSSSPGSLMPQTPSASDDESSPSRPQPVIQPLVIMKHNPRPASPFDDDCVISPSLLQPFKTSNESSVPISPLSPSYLPEAYFDELSDDASDSDSEPESDSEWYTKEFSKIISLRSPIPPFPHQTSTRPDSISFSSSSDISITVPSTRRRASKPLPPTPLSGGFPSPQLDPAYPRRRGSKRRNIPNYPPPPVPTISISSSPPTSPSSASSSADSRRPPPRSSIPADCIYDLADVEEEHDNSSAFSFSIYDVYLGDEPDSLPSAYSQASCRDPMDDVSFDLDCSMMLPLSLPTTPLDLEADIAHGLEQLRSSPAIDGQQFDFIVPPETQETEPEQQQEPQEPPQVVDDVFSPISPSDTTSSNPSPITEEKILKSRWSTSTLGSIREERHESRGGASSKLLRLYFSPLTLKNHKNRSSKKSPATPTTAASSSSPFPSPSPAPALPRNRNKTIVPPVSPRTPPSPASPIRSSKPTTTRGHVRGYSDVIVIGYGNNGVRRRGSLSNSVSDAGSEESCSSTSSSGLRRKPIPVEMFLRSAV